MSSQSVDQFVLKLKRRQITGSNVTAIETANLLRTVISNSRWSNAKSLLQAIREITIRLVQAQPVEFAVGNVARRIMKLIREEYRGITTVTSNAANDGQVLLTSLHHLNQQRQIESPNDSDSDNPLGRSSLDHHQPFNNTPGNRSSVHSDSSMYNLLAQPEPESDYSRQLFSLKQSIIQAVNELIDELEAVAGNVAAQAPELIAPNEVILTVGRSRTVEAFLKQAARKRPALQCIVLEAGPACSGRAMAAALTAAGINTTLVPDAACFAAMSRASKVILGCHAITASGGIIARCGSLIAAKCARHFAVPVHVATGMYKITPIFPESNSAASEASCGLLAAPDAVGTFSDGGLVGEAVEVLNPAFDFVPASLIDVLVTNNGGSPPSYVYRLLLEMYDAEDYSITARS